MILQLLELKAPLLQEEWAIHISGGRLHTLPRLLAGHVPDMDALPEFLVALAVDVAWDDAAARLSDVASVRPPPGTPCHVTWIAQVVSCGALPWCALCHCCCRVCRRWQT